MSEKKILNFPKIIISSVTNKGYKFLPNIINNFVRQDYPYKKLIIIFNSDNVDEEYIKDELYSNAILDYEIKIIPDKSLGYCLNYTISRIPEDYSIWAKMDDDDYYGKNYLMTNLNSMFLSKADVVGRRDMYVYVPEWNQLYFRKNGGNNIFVPWVQGASLFVSKHVFKKVLFPDKSNGEDTYFGHEVRRNGFRTFAAPINDFFVIRRLNNRNHTWKIDLKKYLSFGRIIKSNIFKEKDKHIF